jgi:hypothetical protein
MHTKTDNDYMIKILFILIYLFYKEFINIKNNFVKKLNHYIFKNFLF